MTINGLETAEVQWPHKFPFAVAVWFDNFDSIVQCSPNFQDTVCLTKYSKKYRVDVRARKSYTFKLEYKVNLKATFGNSRKPAQPLQAPIGIAARLRLGSSNVV